MKKAALYIRVSTEEQAKHGFSLSEQQHDLEQYALAHHYTVVGVYADEGNTARKALSRRKELQRLLDDVRADNPAEVLGPLVPQCAGLLQGAGRSRPVRRKLGMHAGGLQYHHDQWAADAEPQTLHRPE